MHLHSLSSLSSPLPLLPCSLLSAAPSNPLLGLKFGSPAAPLLPSSSSSSSHPPTITPSSFNFSTGVADTGISKATFQFSAAKAPLSFTSSQPPTLTTASSLTTLTSTLSQPLPTTSTPSFFTLITSGKEGLEGRGKSLGGCSVGWRLSTSNPLPPPCGGYGCGGSLVD